MKTLEVRPLSASVGAEVAGTDADELASDAAFAKEVLDALETYGVLILRDLNLPPEQQVAFCGHLGAVDTSSKNHKVDGIYRVSLDPANGAGASYLRGTFVWHVDGCTPL